MYDMLPFPNITTKNAEDQVEEIKNFLIQFKETLEFILANIGIDNLSEELVAKLNTMGTEIEKTNRGKDEEIQQMSNKIPTVSDIINSDIFKEALTSEYSFTVNFETGNLEYTR